MAISTIRLITTIALYVALISSTTMAVHIGLFASTGCYSHDVMMRHFADRLSSAEGGGHRVTLIQVRIFEFDRSLAKMNIGGDIGNGTNRTWTDLSYDARGDGSTNALSRLQTRMWTHMVPYDANSIVASVEGARILLRINRNLVDGCYMAMQDARFREEVKKLRLDLLVTDYVLNECALRFTNVLDVHLAYTSNYPILSSYVVDMGTTSAPSYIPSVIGYESTGMSFGKRSVNTVLYTMLWSMRQWFDYEANQMFKRTLGRRYFKSKIRSRVQRPVLSFGTPFEMILDTPRPIARNVHYFGCDHCFDHEENEKRPRAEELLDITLTGSSGIIVVSFGTVTKADLIPVDQLQRFITTFAQFPAYTFIWQLDLQRSVFDQKVLVPINRAMPPNVHLFPWIPLRRLLGDDRVVLSVNHGGISTCSEAVHHGVPILGVALQGDQGYNLRRFVDRGLGEMLPVSDLSEESLRDKLDGLLRDIGRYKSTTLKYRRMIREFKHLYKNVSPSVFWTNWAARHFGRKSPTINSTTTATKATMKFPFSRSTLKAKRFLALRYSSNWFLYYSLDVLGFFAIIFFSIVWAITSVRYLYMPVIYRRLRIRIQSPDGTDLPLSD